MMGLYLNMPYAASHLHFRPSTEWSPRGPHACSSTLITWHGGTTTPSAGQRPRPGSTNTLRFLPRPGYLANIPGGTAGMFRPENHLSETQNGTCLFINCNA